MIGMDSFIGEIEGLNPAIIETCDAKKIKRYIGSNLSRLPKKVTVLILNSLD